MVTWASLMRIGDRYLKYQATLESRMTRLEPKLSAANDATAFAELMRLAKQANDLVRRVERHRQRFARLVARGLRIGPPPNLRTPH
jgi:hypothetical protein